MNEFEPKQNVDLSSERVESLPLSQVVFELADSKQATFEMLTYLDESGQDSSNNTLSGAEFVKDLNPLG